MHAKRKSTILMIASALAVAGCASLQPAPTQDAAFCPAPPQVAAWILEPPRDLLPTLNRLISPFDVKSPGSTPN